MTPEEKIGRLECEVGVWRDRLFETKAELAELRAEASRLAEELAHERSLRGYTNRGSIADTSWRGLGTW